ncbi:tRNA methyltransferase complex GCD14 subunit [Panus rudis PR-1116 ss-1]|nr:tRNA methyltransferase complex GCD14 subunit [Panus rudis PR-1116 ss-1]
MWSTAREIAEGDLVIVWMTRDLVQPLVIEAGKELNTRYGVYRHRDLIGVPYGSKIGSRNGKGFIHVLRPTPELWTLALPHRTQILYLADIAFIISWLDIKPGSRVIEAGTGSGSFSHSVARTIGPAGHLWSYEFHEARYGKASEEFTRHGMSNIVTLTHRNVCKDGFTVVDTVDSIFLDLPAPWEAVEHAKKALRKDRPTRICCFSPCMEQVLRTVTALNDAGFTDITMYETLIRPHQVDVVPAPLPISAIRAQLRQSEAKREAKRLRQIASAPRTGRGDKRKREESEDNNQHPAESEDSPGKRVKTEVEGSTEQDASLTEGANEPNIVLPAAVLEHLSTASPAGSGQQDESSSDPPNQPSISISKAFPEVRGHTSYLTFAVLLPASVLAEASAAQSTVASSEVTPDREIAPAA